MRISIAMATYNGAKYLGDQLDSFLQQTRIPDELVVCDDGSTDTTLDILEIFSQQAPFEVQVFINEKNLGYTKNFEKAINNCTGNVIFLSDQDDVWHAHKISVILETFLVHQDKLLIVHDGDLVDDSLDSHGATKLGQIVAGYGNSDPLITGALTAFRRELLTFALPIPDGIKGHDGWLHNIARFLETRFVLDQPLQIIRRHATNTSAWAASSTKKINRFDIWQDQFRTPVPTGYEDRLLINQSCKERLNIVLSQSVMFSRDIIERSLLYLENEHRVLLNRSNLVKSGRLKRKFIAMHLLLKGDYKYFNGLRSFLRDILR